VKEFIENNPRVMGILIVVLTASIYVLQGSYKEDLEVALLILAGIVMLVAVPTIYFLPALVASKREHKQKTAITVLNLFLGWTVLGWVGALVWAVTN